MNGSPIVLPMLTKRERQIMDILYERGEATAQEVRAALSAPPSYSAVRALLRILEEKGHIAHREEASRYIYMPTRPRQSAARGALQNLVKTFFGGSVTYAVETLLSEDDLNLSNDDLKRLTALVEAAKQREATERET